MGVITLILHIVYLLFLHSTTIFVLVQGASYTPKDNYLIACGSSTATATDPDGRTWVGDLASSYYLGGILESVAASTSAQNPNLPSTVPFLGARIFTAPISYSFPVTPGRHWLRLYFYPFAYENYDPGLAIVTVNGENYALVANMSITREMHALNYDYIQKEFSINVISNPLVVIFAPGESKDAYGMVNGIEVISMPDDMFASSVHNVDISALETMYRVNMGGPAVNAASDELSRTWDTDIGFIPTAAAGVAERTSHPIQYGSANNYTAPQIVYQTARTMTNNDFVNLNFNLTWRFSVNPAFSYYVRLHFCEFVYTLINNRVFDVFINSEVALQQFDVLNADIRYGNAGSGPYKAFVMDFATSIASNSTWDASNIVVALHPTNATAPTHFNSILNGLEIFKLNDSYGNLQGPPPPLIAVPSVKSTPRPSHGGLKKPIIGAVAGAAAAVPLLLVGCFVCMHRRKKIAKNVSLQAWLVFPLCGGMSRLLVIKGPPCKRAAGRYDELGHHFTFDEISHMTNNFDDARVLGVGGFGKVYEGVLEDGAKVAVKRGSPSSRQGVVEFRTEIELLSKLRHRHVVSLIGYCEEHNEMILVYDYMANGPLRDHLYGTDLPQLSWKQRLEICIGAARGLHYLHTGSAHGVIHRDVKTTNILLDENFIAKVSDFGLSKKVPTLDHTHVSTTVKGSLGYLDPEYFRQQQLTDKSDVYSFGVVLMEVLCAKPVMDPSSPRSEQMDLAEWAMKLHKEGILDQIIDPYLVGGISRESLNKFVETAERCLQDRSSERPTMEDVLWNLVNALQLHEPSVEKALDESVPQIVDLPIRDQVDTMNSVIDPR